MAWPAATKLGHDLAWNAHACVLGGIIRHTIPCSAKHHPKKDCANQGKDVRPEKPIPRSTFLASSLCRRPAGRSCSSASPAGIPDFLSLSTKHSQDDIMINDLLVYYIQNWALCTADTLDLWARLATCASRLPPFFAGLVLLLDGSFPAGPRLEAAARPK